MPAAFTTKIAERRAGMRPPKTEPALPSGAGPDLGAAAGMPAFLQRITARPRLKLDPANAAYEHGADRVSAAIESLDQSPLSHPVHRTRSTATVAEPSLEGSMLRQGRSLATRGPVIQPKLTVSQPNDPYEREADQIADRVMRMPAPQSINTTLSYSSVDSRNVQRKCASCDEEEKRLQRKEQGADSPTAVAPIVHESLNSSGQPLDPGTRSFMEECFGHDFGQVRVHSDARASDAARAVRARAYATGGDIVFGSGEYAPATAEGKRLLAHELAHVVQQREGGASVTRVQRQVAPEYVVDDPHAGRTPPGAGIRVFFARNSSAIPGSESPKIDAFKSGPDRTVNLTLLGLATEDEIAAVPSLPADRANAVDTALGTLRMAPPPFNTKHDGIRTVTPGTLANTQNRPNLSFNRAVELLPPGVPTMSPSTAIAPATACNAAIETQFQAAKTMAFDWIDSTRPEVNARPITGPIAAELDRFFGNHTPETARRVDHNLGLIRTEIDSLAQPANHNCADPNLPGCVSAIAFNSRGRMTICSGYSSHPAEDRARNLVHEAGHSTAGLRITGSRNAPPTSDFAYRHERLIHLLGAVNPDQALSNSDSYSMFLMTRRASAAITPGLLPTSDPAPSGFANTAQAEKTQRAVALAQVWLRLAQQGLTDLHEALRNVGVGNAVPANLGDPRRLDKILAQVRLDFPPILSTANLRADDLLMIAGVLDRYDELKRLIGQPIATSPGATTALAAVAPVAPATTGSLTLTVDASFLAANERARARTVVDKLIELVSATRISAAMRSKYRAFAEFVRDLHQ